jgi:hypothetical protein
MQRACRIIAKNIAVHSVYTAHACMLQYSLHVYKSTATLGRFARYTVLHGRPLLSGVLWATGYASQRNVRLLAPIRPLSDWL